MTCPPEWLHRRSADFCTFLFSMLVVLFPTASSGYELYIGTDESGSFSYFAGKTICKILSGLDGEIVCQPVPQESAAESLTNLQSGALDFSLVGGMAIENAARGHGQFEYMDISFDAVRLVLPLYHEAVVVIAGGNAGIESLDDLVGHRVNGGAPSSRENSIFRQVMVTKGWDRSVFALYQNLPSKKNQDIIAFKAGSIEAMVYVGVFPDSAKQKEIVRMGGRIVPLDDPAVRAFASPLRGFGMTWLHVVDLSGLPKDVLTLGVETLLLTTVDADRQIVMSVMQALAGNPERLRRAHPALLPWKIESNLLDNRPVAPHPEAMAYVAADTQ